MKRSERNAGLSRRGFIAGATALIGGVISAVLGLPAIAYLISPGLEKTETDVWVPLGPVDKLVEGQPTLFQFTRTQRTGWEATAISYGVYVIRKGSDEYDVFSNVCTHLSCRYTWREDLNHFFCPCHDGHYAKDGTVLAGPPPRPLDRFEHRIENGTLFVHVMEG